MSRRSQRCAAIGGSTVHRHGSWVMGGYGPWSTMVREAGRALLTVREYE
jgi:hypothetical protein